MAEYMLSLSCLAVCYVQTLDLVDKETDSIFCIPWFRKRSEETSGGEDLLLLPRQGIQGIAPPGLSLCGQHLDPHLHLLGGAAGVLLGGQKLNEIKVDFFQWCIRNKGM